MLNKSGASATFYASSSQEKQTDLPYITIPFKNAVISGGLAEYF
jgi:hypothetical protein